MRFSIIRRATVSRASFPKLFNAQHSTHKNQDRIARFGFSDPGSFLLCAVVCLLRVICFAGCPFTARHPSAIPFVFAEEMRLIFSAKMGAMHLAHTARTTENCAQNPASFLGRFRYRRTPGFIFSGFLCRFQFPFHFAADPFFPFPWAFS